jgi:hypothetical protein
VLHASDGHAATQIGAPYYLSPEICKSLLPTYGCGSSHGGLLQRCSNGRQLQMNSAASRHMGTASGGADNIHHHKCPLKVLKSTYDALNLSAVPTATIHRKLASGARVSCQYQLFKWSS